MGLRAKCSYYSVCIGMKEYSPLRGWIEQHDIIILHMWWDWSAAVLEDMGQQCQPEGPTCTAAPPRCFLPVPTDPSTNLHRWTLQVTRLWTYWGSLATFQQGCWIKGNAMAVKYWGERLGCSCSWWSWKTFSNLSNSMIVWFYEAFLYFEFIQCKKGQEIFFCTSVNCQKLSPLWFCRESYLHYYLLSRLLGHLLFQTNSQGPFQFFSFWKSLFR